MEKYKGIYWVPVRLNPRFKHDPEEAALRIPVMNALKLIQGESNYVTFCKAMVIINDHRSRGVTEGEAKSNFRVLVEEITPGPDLAAARAHLLGQVFDTLVLMLSSAHIMTNTARQSRRISTLAHA